MQRHPTRRIAVRSVLAVARHRMPYVFHVRSYLVFLARLELQLHQRKAVPETEHPIARNGPLPGRASLVTNTLYPLLSAK